MEQFENGIRTSAFCDYCGHMVHINTDLYDKTIDGNYYNASMEPYYVVETSFEATGMLPKRDDLVKRTVCCPSCYYEVIKAFNRIHRPNKMMTIREDYGWIPASVSGYRISSFSYPDTHLISPCDIMQDTPVFTEDNSEEKSKD